MELASGSLRGLLREMPFVLPSVEWKAFFMTIAFYATVNYSEFPDSS